MASTHPSGAAFSYESDFSIADLHHILQIVFHWSDFRLHRFLIRGKEYGISRTGCTGFTTDPQKVSLADFGFRRKERFLYERDFSDLWQHQIRYRAGPPLYPQEVKGIPMLPLLPPKRSGHLKGLRRRT